MLNIKFTSLGWVKTSKAKNDHKAALAFTRVYFANAIGICYALNLWQTFLEKVDRKTVFTPPSVSILKNEITVNLHFQAGTSLSFCENLQSKPLNAVN